MTGLPPGVRFEQAYGCDVETDVDDEGRFRILEIEARFLVWDTWRVVITLGPTDGWTLAKLTVEAIGSVPPGGLTIRELRKLPLPAMQAAARQEVADGARSWGQPGLINASTDLVEALSSQAADVEKERRPGRPRIPEMLLAECAAAYVDALRDHPDAPVKALAIEQGIDIGTARARVRQARVAGLLPLMAKRGLQGGYLTEKAISILREQNR